MIAQLVGAVLSAGANWIILDVNGVGFHVHTNAGTAAAVRIGEQTTVYTSLIVREDSLSIWGFSSPAEREAFELVQKVQGIGPKVAGAMLSVFSAADLRTVISNGDIRRLSSVPGIGNKVAQKIILELKEKVLLLPADANLSATRLDESWRLQVAEGLEGLGWSAKEADKACDAVAPLVAEDPKISIGSLMRAALAKLAKR